MKQKKTKTRKKSKTALDKKPKEKQPVLTMDTVKKMINPLVTDKEAFNFLQLCKSQNLNPFIKEAYLIKYSANQQATMVVGKDVFTKRANRQPEYDGTKAGVIVKLKDSGALKYREGSFVDEPGKVEILVGGWAETFRKDRKIPFRAEVSMKEYDKGQSSWNKMPATMIRKVALVQSLREAFPETFQGLYDSAEMGVELSEPKDVTPPADGKPGPKEDKPKEEKIETKATSEPPKNEPSIKKDLITAIIKMLKDLGCKTTEDVKSLIGYDSIDGLNIMELGKINDKLKKIIQDKEKNEGGGN